jgi:hypothetical protein
VHFCPLDILTSLGVGVGAVAWRSLHAVLAAPRTGLDGVDVQDVHGVNLLESAVLGLDQEEEDNEHEDGAASGEDETVQVVDGVGDESGAIRICQY